MTRMILSISIQRHGKGGNKKGAGKVKNLEIEYVVLVDSPASLLAPLQLPVMNKTVVKKMIWIYNRRGCGLN